MVSAGMERAGVKVDADLLTSMSRDMDEQLQSLTKQIHHLAKGEFNINSPKQVGEVLFEMMNLPSFRKT